jgi:hypothetical protein
VKLSEHSALSAGAAVGIYFYSGSLVEAVAFAIFGILVDLDHLIDYLRETGFNLKIKDFMGYFETRKPLKLWLVFHSWDFWLFIFAVTFFWDGHYIIMWGLAGWFFHLGLDQFSNRLHPLAYFFVFRLNKKFKAEELYVDKINFERNF